MYRKTTQILLTVIASITVFSSCSKDEEITENGSNGKTRIQLKSHINQTLTESELQKEHIKDGQKVGLIVTTEDSESVLYDNIEFTANGKGGLSSDSLIYYPTNGGEVNLLAYCPYDKDIRLTKKDTYTFKVENDQSNENNYLNSDFLYASVKNVKRTRDDVHLRFKHVFSKLTFTVKKGAGATLENLGSIEVLGLVYQANISLKDGSVSSSSGPTADIKAFNVPTGNATNEELSGASAIVVPQSLATNKPLLRITINSVPYLYTPSEILKLESGTAYNYTITVNMAGISVTSEITDWEDGGNINGTGEIS